MKFKLKNTKFQIVMEVIAIIILVSMVAVLIIRWKELPDQIPGHYNAIGEVDRWGSKGELIMLPVLSIFLYLLITIVTAFPSIWNMPVTITEANREKVYSCMKSMMALIKVEVLAVFFCMNYNSMEATSLSPLFLPLFLVVIIGTIIYFVKRTIRLSKEANSANQKINS